MDVIKWPVCVQVGLVAGVILIMVLVTVWMASNREKKADFKQEELVEKFKEAFMDAMKNQQAEGETGEGVGEEGKQET